MISYLTSSLCLSVLYAVKQTLRTLALPAAFGPPTFEPCPNAHTRIEVSRLDIREVERKDALWWLHSLSSQVACLYGRRGGRIRLSGEARVERRLRASVEARKGGRSSTLDRSIGGQGLFVASPRS